MGAIVLVKNLTIFFLLFYFMNCSVKCQIPAENVIECPPSCNKTAKPCDCYQFGWVDCSNRNLLSIPSALPQCVRRLVIRHNDLTELEGSDFTELVSLNELEITNEPLQRITAGLFAGLTELRHLNLSNNQISTIEECGFVGLNLLIQLSLDSNNISVIGSRTFVGLLSLVELTLKNNRIAVIGNHAFDNLNHLQQLSIYNNRISSLDVQWFQDKPNISNIFASKNHWNCTCSLKQSFSFINRYFEIPVYCIFPNFEFNLFCVECSTPENLLQQSIQNISFDSFPSCSPLTYPQPINELTPEENNDYCRARLLNRSQSERNQSRLHANRTSSAPTNAIASNASQTTSETAQQFKQEFTTVFQQEKATTTTTNMTATSTDRIPVWGIVLIILSVLFLSGFIFIFSAFLIRQTKRHSKHSYSQNETEMQMQKISEKNHRNQIY